MADQNRVVNPEEFLINLEKENIQYLIMTHDLFTDTWPEQKEILNKSKNQAVDLKLFY